MIYVLYFEEYDYTDQRYFSTINKIVEFLNRPEQHYGPLWHTVVYMQLDSNKRQPVHVDGYAEPCNSFAINKFGEIRPLNVHRSSSPA